jgi:hypothetical protein
MAPVSLPLLFINPIDDDEFRSAVGVAFGPSSQTVVGLQAALRKSYPTAVVRPRDLQGAAEVVWYVYRDGHWVPRRVT